MAADALYSSYLEWVIDWYVCWACVTVGLSMATLVRSRTARAQSAFLSLTRVPFYREAKMALLLWLTVPNSKAPRLIFEALVEPAMEAVSELVHHHGAVTGGTMALRAAVATQQHLLPMLAKVLSPAALAQWEQAIESQTTALQRELSIRSGDVPPTPRAPSTALDRTSPTRTMLRQGIHAARDAASSMSHAVDSMGAWISSKLPHQRAAEEEEAEEEEEESTHEE